MEARSLNRAENGQQQQNGSETDHSVRHQLVVDALLLRLSNEKQNGISASLPLTQYQQELQPAAPLSTTFLVPCPSLIPSASNEVEPLAPSSSATAASSATTRLGGGKFFDGTSLDRKFSPESSLSGSIAEQELTRRKAMVEPRQRAYTSINISGGPTPSESTALLLPAAMTPQLLSRSANYCALDSQQLLLLHYGLDQHSFASAFPEANTNLWPSGFPSYSLGHVIGPQHAGAAQMQDASANPSYLQRSQALMLRHLQGSALLSRYSMLPGQGERSSHSITPTPATPQGYDISHERLSTPASHPTGDSSSKPSKVLPSHHTNRHPFASFRSLKPLASSLTKGGDISTILAKRSEFNALVPAGSISFPVVLHRALVELEGFQGGAKIASFMPDGKAFQVRNQFLFQEHVISVFFPNMSSFGSFQRQLNLYDFERIGGGGADRGAYHHIMFVREFPERCAKMKRRKVKGNQSTSARRRGGKSSQKNPNNVPYEGLKDTTSSTKEAK